MIFLIVFICCVFELTCVSFARFRSGAWIISWHNWLSDNCRSRKVLGRASILGSLVLPCALLAYMFNVIFVDSTLLTLLGGTAVLLYCSGPGDIAQEIESYRRNYLDEDGFQPSLDANNFLNKIDVSADVPYLRSIAVETNDRLFSPIFWFTVLGPVGALFFRMGVTLKVAGSPHAADVEIATRLYDILIWIPARLLAVGLGLAGTLAPVMNILGEQSFRLAQSDILLGDSAIAALDKNRPTTLNEGDQRTVLIDGMFSLIKRGFVVWLGILALFVVAGFA